MKETAAMILSGETWCCWASCHGNALNRTICECSRSNKDSDHNAGLLTYYTVLLPGAEMEQRTEVGEREGERVREEVRERERPIESHQWWRTAALSIYQAIPPQAWGNTHTHRHTSRQQHVCRQLIYSLTLTGSTYCKENHWAQETEGDMPACVFMPSTQAMFPTGAVFD